MSSPAPALADVERILLATDFSDCSRLALPYARVIARLSGAAVQVVHVVPPEPTAAVPVDALPAALDIVRAAAESSMAEFVRGDVLTPRGERDLLEEADLITLRAERLTITPARIQFLKCRVAANAAA